MPHKDPEARKAYGRARYAANREKFAAKNKAHYEANREKIAAREKAHYEANREKVAARNKAHYEANREKIAAGQRAYEQTPQGRKAHTKKKWKSRGLVWQDESDFDRIYELWQTQELCNACDCVLTRGEGHTRTTACMDHDHETHHFRHIICMSCNSRDSWMKYFC